MTNKMKQISVGVLALIFILSGFLASDKGKPKKPKTRQREELYTPRQVHAELIRSEYARELISGYSQIGRADIKLLQQQAKEAWPEASYYVINTKRERYNYKGHTYLMTVGTNWVFGPYNEADAIKDGTLKTKVKKSW